MRASGETSGSDGELAARRQVAATGALFLQGEDSGARENLGEAGKPVLFANGAHDVMIYSHASYAAARRLPHATLILCSNPVPRIPFRHEQDFGEKGLAFLRG